MTPAIIGIGFLHVLAGMLIWIVLPLLSGKVNSEAKKNEALVWRTPDDFIEQTQSKSVTAPMSKNEPEVPIPNPELAKRPSIAMQALSPASFSGVPAPQPPPSAEAVKVGTSLAVTNPARLQFTPADAKKTLTAKSPFEILTAHQPVKLTAIPQDTLSKLERSAGPPGQDLLGSSSALTIQSNPLATTPTPMADPDAEPGTPQKLMATSGREANKYITLSAIQDVSYPTKPTLSLLDIAKLNEAEREQQKALRSSGLDAIEHALQQTLLRAWMPPSIDLVPANQRRVSVELAVLRDGRVKDVILKTPSGSEALDASVRAALARVTKIPESLPASFPKERYAVRVNLQIE